MESSFFEIVASLGLVDIIGLGMTGVLLVYYAMTRQLPQLMFVLVLSAALVGSTIPVLGTIAPLVRWLVILLFMVVGFSIGKLRISPGFMLFWGYALLGFISLFRSISFGYQFQRCVLLLVVAFMIPLVYCNKIYPIFRSSLQAIALAASVFCLLNFVLLPGELSDVGRFSGLTKGAASFAVFLGGLLPFTLWGAWKTRKWIRIVCLLGFITGFVTLFFTGQRTGTLGGFISLIPLFLLMQNRKTFGLSFLLLIGIFCLCFILFQQSDSERNSFLIGRYSYESGLSGRESIWSLAMTEINENPVIGRGIGASEMFFSSSFHNSYLEVWYNTGFLGLILFISAQIYFLYRAFHLLIHPTDPETRPMAALAIGYMLGFLGMSFFESIAAGASSINLILYLFVSFLVSGKTFLRFVPDVEKMDRPGAIRLPARVGSAFRVSRE